MKNTLIRVLTIVLLVAALLLISCLEPVNDAEKVAAAKEKLTVPEETDSDLDLPVVLNGVTISWTSSDEDVISNTGKVTRQPSDTLVKLIATLALGNAVDTKEFTVRVITVVIIEEEAELFDFYKYSPFSSQWPPWIEMMHPDENTVFDCTADKGHFSLYGPYIPLKNIRVHSLVPVQWYFYEIGGNQSSDKVEQAFIEIVIRLEENIIGYAVIEAIWMAGPRHSLNPLRYVIFPKTDGEYQNVSKEYVKAAIDKIKNEAIGGS